MSTQTKQVIRHTFPTVSEPPYPLLTYGLPFYEACAKEVRDTFSASKAYIIASRTLSIKTPFLTQLQEALGSKLVGTWIGIPNHTPINSLIPIIADIKEKKADIIITIGGGSISDGAKLISFALANDVSTAEELANMPHISNTLSADFVPEGVKAPEIPVICIPISLSGGEYSRYAGVTDPFNHKEQFTHEKMFPSLIVLDPVLTESTPISFWLSSGVRSIDHCVEGFCSKNATEEGDAAAKKALVLLVNGLLRTKQDPTDSEARLRCQLGSNLSLTLLYLGVMKGASHGIGHQLGPLGVAHGDTSCILLPAVSKYNAKVNGAKQEILKNLLCQEPMVQEVMKNASLSENEADLGDILRAIFNVLGMPKSLKDVGVKKEQIDQLVESSMTEVFVLSNPRPLTRKEDIMEIIHMVEE